MARPLPDPNLYLLGQPTGGGMGFPDVGGFLGSLISRWRDYEHMRTRMMDNSFALSGQGVYPGASYDLARHGTNLLNSQPDPRAALIGILRGGGGFIRG